MNTWFDRLARRVAHSSADAVEAPTDESGLSRRQVLARGALLTGAAWTAPALLAARPAFAGASICTDPNFPVFDVCANVEGTEVCCPIGEECVEFTNGTFDCDVPPGGECTNRGNGQCNGGNSRCDQPSNQNRFGICGGPGTICSDGSNCEFGDCSEIDGRCGGAGATCTIDDECAPVDANDKKGFSCQGGICVQNP